jgi:hypothetical protein
MLYYARCEVGAGARPHDVSKQSARAVAARRRRAHSSFFFCLARAMLARRFMQRPYYHIQSEMAASFDASLARRT